MENAAPVFYLQRDGERYGPYSWEQIWTLAEQGNLNASDLIWSAELVNWTPVHRIDSLRRWFPDIPGQRNVWPIVALLLVISVLSALGLVLMLKRSSAGPEIDGYYPEQGAAGTQVAIAFRQATDLQNLRIRFGQADLPKSALSDRVVGVNIPLDAASGSLELFWEDRLAQALPFTVLEPKAQLLVEQPLQPSAQSTTVRSPEGYSVTLPGGLLDQARVLTIQHVENPAVLNDNPFSPVDVVDISLDGMEQLGDYIEIGVPYDPSLLDASIPAEAQFTPARWDAETRTWVDLYFRLDETEHKIYFITDHLSPFLTGFSLLGLAKTAGIVAVVGATLGEVAERWANDKYLSRNWKIRVLYSDAALRKTFPDDEWKMVMAPANLRLGGDYDTKTSFAVQDIALIFEEALDRYMKAGFPDPTRKGIWGAHIYTRYIKVKMDSYYNYAVQQGEMAHETFWDTIHIPTEIIKYEFFDPVQNQLNTFESRFTFFKSGLAHELFHAIQRPYYGLGITFLETQHTWWREATAEWAGHDLARIPYRTGWDRDPAILMTRLAPGFLQHPINVRGKISGTTTEQGGLEHEYLAAIFVRYLVRECHLNIKELLETVAKSGRKTDPLIPLRRFVKSKTGKSFDRITDEYAIWLLAESQMRISDFENPSNGAVVAAKSDTVFITEELATLRLSQKAAPPAERIVVFRSAVGEETVKDPAQPFAVLNQEAPAFVQMTVEDGDILYFVCANGLSSDRRVNLEIERNTPGESGSGETWSRAASVALELNADGTAKVWAVRISSGKVRIEPPEIVDALGFREYPFEVIAEGLASTIDEVTLEYDFGDQRKDSRGSETLTVEAGKASFTLKHRYLPSPSVKPEDEPLTHVLAVDMRYRNESLGKAQARVTVNQAEVSIQPPRVLVLELTPGATETTETFTAMAQPQAPLRFEWDFGDGQTFSDPDATDAQSEATHTFTGLAPGQTYHPQVRVYGPEGEFLAVDRITINTVSPGGTGKLVLIDRKVSSTKAGMVGAEPGDPYWKVGPDSATVDFQYQESWGYRETKWERTVTTRFRYEWGLLPRTIAPDEKLEFPLRIEDTGCSVTYSEGSHALKKRENPHMNKTQSAAITIHSGNEEYQLSKESVGTLYEVGEGPAKPVASTWSYSASRPDDYHEGDIRKIVVTLKQYLTETTIIYTYQYSEK